MASTAALARIASPASAGTIACKGTRGSDSLAGGAGDDTLVGGKDTDCLVGGAGGDRYRWRKGDGEDYAIDFRGDGFGGDGEGTIEFLGHVLAGTLTLENDDASGRIDSSLWRSEGWGGEGRRLHQQRRG